MNRRNMFSMAACSIALVCMLAGCATRLSQSESGQGQKTRAEIPTESIQAGSVTPAARDPNHPLHIGEEYYPPESRKHGEEGTCVVRLLVAADGYIRATQLVTSAGFERLNAACLSSFGDGRMIPARVGGKPVTSWYMLRVNWKLSGARMIFTPQIRDDYQLKVGLEDYPPISLKLHQEGDCIVHATVDKNGPPSAVSLTKSTGYSPLDQACISAVQQAQFMAARLRGSIFSAATDVNIYWRLPLP